MSVLPVGIGGDSSGYQIQRSLRLRASANAYLNRTFAAGNQQRWTWSGWVKRGTLGTLQTLFSQGTGVTGNGYGFLRFNTSDQLEANFTPDGATSSGTLNTVAVYRDPSAHYHVVFTLDTTAGTNGLTIYVNGVSALRSFSTGIALNANLQINRNQAHQLCASNAGGLSTFLDGYLSEVNFVDGQALTPTSFGQIDATTGQWTAKKYTGTYGTNGFYLPFTNTTTPTTLCNDASGNSNHWTPSNISLTAGATWDSMLDVPLGGGGGERGNYATLSPIGNNIGVAAGFVIEQGNLALTVSNNSGYRNCEASWLPTGLKGYYEVTHSGAPNSFLGFQLQSVAPVNNSPPQAGTFHISDAGNALSGTTTIRAGSTSAFVTTDVLMVAFDFTGSNRNVWFGRNGTWGTDSGGVTGVPSTGSNPVLTVTQITGDCRFFFATNSGGGSYSVHANFGQRPFQYTPPTGFKALHTGNLPDPAIAQPNKHFDVVTYLGNGATKTVTGATLQPDFAWPKGRGVAYSHGLYDIVRGVTKKLSTDGLGAENTSGMTAFTSDGFTLDSDAGLNQNGASYVAWLWKAGGAAVTNTAGSISSQVSANALAGFSIVTYTGTRSVAGTDSIGHGLGLAPKLVISKARNPVGADTGNWFTWHASTAVDNFLRLNTTAGVVSIAASGGGTMLVPTSSLFYAPYISGASVTGNTYVAYCFAEIAGYSRIGSYVGNSSADGPFVYCGFRPRYVLLKGATVASNWVVVDTARSTENVCDEWLLPNGANLEQAQVVLDVTATGFKVRSSLTEFNSSGHTYIFLAFAEAPFRNALAR